MQLVQNKGLELRVIVLCEAGTDPELVDGAGQTWRDAEERFPGTRVLLVEVAGGSLAAQNLARNLLTACMPPHAALVSLHFPVPLLGDVRAIPLEVVHEVQSLRYSVTHCTMCACHGQVAALGPGAPVQEGPACPVSGGALSGAQYVVDSKIVCLGGTSAAVLHLTTPLAISAAGGGAVLTVVRRVKLGEVLAGGLCGPPIVLRGKQKSGAVKLAWDGQLLNVLYAQLVSLLAATLR